MFIELSEFLRCPEPHQETFCVVAPQEMAGRQVTRGLVGCPICRREYPIERGVVWFGRGDENGGGEAPDERGAQPDPDVIRALLGLTGPGGFVVLVGSAARLAQALAAAMDGVHFVGVDAPAEISASPSLSLLVHPARIPLRHAMARGVVLGAERAVEPWISEGARVLLPGLRLVAASEAIAAPGVAPLAAGNGLWVGRKSG